MGVLYIRNKQTGKFEPVRTIKGKDGYTPQKNVDYFDGKDGSPGATGNPGADGVGISSVKQTTTSGADGGNNVVTVTLTNGATSTFTVKNGSKGSTGNTGYTPQKGIDYWTSDEQESIVQQVTTSSESFIADELAKRGQLKPEFANAIDECTDTSKVYVLPDGYIYAYMRSLQYPFTNKIPLSINSDGSLFIGANGEQGYKTGYSLNANGTEGTGTNYAAYAVTGFIPVKKGDVVRFHNFNYVMGSSGGSYFALYDSSFAKVQSQIDKSMTTTSISYLINNITVDSANSMTGFTIVDKYNNGISYLRISGKGIDSSTIVTVNEEITGPTYEYTWKSTGHQFAPADCEERIIPLEEKTTSHETRIRTLETYGSDSTSAEDIPAYIKAEADSVINRVIEKQGNRNFTMIAMSDFHYSGTGDNKDNLIRACKAIHYMQGRIHIDAVATLGDNLPYGGDYSATIRTNADRWSKEINEILSVTQKPGIVDFRTPGNHDRFGTIEQYMPDNAIFSFISGYNRQCEIGDVPGGWAYKDFSGYKLRVIVLNTAECEGKGRFNAYSGFHISTAQYKWLIDTLDLSGKPDAADWQILVLSHHKADDYQAPATNASTNNYILPNILHAYNTGGSYTGVNAEDSKTISCNFAGKNTAKLIGQIHGHHHAYIYGMLCLGSGGTQTNVMAISTPTSGFGTGSGHNDDNAGTWYDSVKDTAEETAFCVYCIDLDNHVVQAIHYGNGLDRVINY